MLRFAKSQYADLRGWGVVAFVVLNVSVRLWMLFHGGGTMSATKMPDEGTYLRIAAELETSGPSWLLTARALQAAPAHVVLLALLGGSVAAVKLVSMVASVATLVPVWSIARRTLPVRAVFWVAVAFTSCLAFSEYALSLLTESINGFLLTSAIALFVNAAAEGSSRRVALASGVVLGFATLWRATTLLYPLALVLLVAAVWAVGPSRRRITFAPPELFRAIGFLALGLSLIVAPVILKNGLATGHWKLATGQGATMYLGADQKADGWEPVFSGYDYDTFEVSAPFTHLEPEGDARLSQAAMRQIRRDPLGTLAMRWHWPVRLFIGEPHDLFNPTDSAPRSWAVLKKNATLLTMWNLCWRVMALVFSIAFFVKTWRTAEGFVLMSVPLYFLVLFLPMFVVSRYSVPILPLLSVSMIGGMLSSRPRVLLTALSASLIIGIAFGRAVFPSELDPSRFTHHSELARWSANTGDARWRAAYGAAELAGDSGAQRFVATAATPNLVADGQSVPLDRNQIFVLSLVARPRPAGWALHTYWRSTQNPSFSEPNTVDAFVVEGEKTVRFQMPAREGDQLQALRVDLDLPAEERASIGPGRSENPLSIGSSWSCHFGCSEAHRDGDLLQFRGGAEPEAVTSELSAPMQSPLWVTVPVDLPRQGQPVRPAEFVTGILRWRTEGTLELAPQAVAFALPVDAKTHWVQINPSLGPGSQTWNGRLGLVSIQFQTSKDVEIEFESARLLKDYRMLRP